MRKAAGADEMYKQREPEQCTVKCEIMERTIAGTVPHENEAPMRVNKEIGAIAHDGEGRHYAREEATLCAE